MTFRMNLRVHFSTDAYLSLIVATVFVSALAWPLAANAQAARAMACKVGAGEIVATSGAVERLGSDADNWMPTKRGDQICAGDSVRTGALSRATIFLTSKKTLVRLDAETRLRLAKEESADLAVRLFEGLTYFFSRTPVRLEVDTPHVNGGIEGTEFLLRAAEADKSTQVVVYEGRYAFAKTAKRRAMKSTGTKSLWWRRMSRQKLFLSVKWQACACGGRWLIRPI